MNFRSLLCAGVIACLPLTLFSADKVDFTPDGTNVKVSIAGQEFATYHMGKEWKKPFFHPVMLDDTDITRPVDPNEKEHPHHKGIWVSIDEVNEIKFWAEKGLIVNAETKFKTVAETGAGEMLVVNHWLGEDEKPVVIETTRIQIFPNRLMIYDISFTSPEGEVVFDDTKEGLLGFRMAQSMRESEGGIVVGADGKKGTAETWGQPNKWIDYYGNVNDKVVGVTIMDHPENLRPSRYHVRNYGLFSISPFGDKAYTGGKEEAKPYHLQPGQKLHLRYGIYFHPGNTEEGKVEAAYTQFLEAK